MVQSVLFFVLGFLCAAFLTLVIAPAFWRRAVSLTRRRVEASIPLTQSEIQAQRDQLRAEFAMNARRLEMTVQALQQKIAAQAVEIGRGNEELKKAIAGERRGEQEIKALEAEGSALRSQLGEAQEQIRGLKEQLDKAEQFLKERDDEYRKAMRLYEDASFSSSNRQIELAAREAELEKLATDMATLRNQHKAADRRYQEAAAETRASRDALQGEKQRAADMDKRLERLLAALADHEEKLDRREKEVSRLRQKLKNGMPMSNGHASDVHAEKARRADPGSAQAGTALMQAGFANGDAEAVVARLNAARDRLETGLLALSQESKLLKSTATKIEGANGGRGHGAASLREQMSTLAAEVVDLAMRLDGPDSPIAKALDAGQGAKPGPGGVASLADRVRALQKSSAPG